MAMPPGMMPPGPAGAGARMKVAVKPTQVGSPHRSADWDGREGGFRGGIRTVARAGMNWGVFNTHVRVSEGCPWCVDKVLAWRESAKANEMQCGKQGSNVKTTLSTRVGY